MLNTLCEQGRILLDMRVVQVLLFAECFEGLSEEEGVFHGRVCELDIAFAGFGGLEEGFAVAQGVVGGEGGDWGEGGEGVVHSGFPVYEGAEDVEGAGFEVGERGGGGDVGHCYGFGLVVVVVRSSN